MSRQFSAGTVEILQHFPDYSQHSYQLPCCATYFEHIFLSVLPLHYKISTKTLKMTQKANKSSFFKS